MKRPLFIGFLAVLVLACAACGGGAKKSAASQGLPSTLVQQIKAEVRNPASVIGGAASATTADVYGPASYRTIDKVWEGGQGATKVSGRWYLIVLHGHFTWTGSVPPGATQPHARIALEVWSPKSAIGRGFSFAKRVPAAVSRLGGHAVVDLS